MTCPKCGAPMDDAKTVRWAFHEWLACPGCDTFVKPSFFDGPAGRRPEVAA